MDEREGQAREIYREFRFAGQHKYYSERLEEYERAHSQALWTSGVLMLAASAAGVFGAGELLGNRTVWGIASMIFAALAGLVTSYDALLGYERISDLYRSTRAALNRARALEPAEGADGLATFVGEVEEIFQQEHGQWSQTIVQTPPPPPQATTQ